MADSYFDWRRTGSAVQPCGGALSDEHPQPVTCDLSAVYRPGRHSGRRHATLCRRRAYPSAPLSVSPGTHRSGALPDPVAVPGAAGRTGMGALDGDAGTAVWSGLAGPVDRLVYGGCAAARPAGAGARSVAPEMAGNTALSALRSAAVRYTASAVELD